MSGRATRPRRPLQQQQRSAKAAPACSSDEDDDQQALADQRRAAGHHHNHHQQQHTIPDSEDEEEQQVGDVAMDAGRRGADASHLSSGDDGDSDDDDDTERGTRRASHAAAHAGPSSSAAAAAAAAAGPPAAKKRRGASASGGGDQQGGGGSGGGVAYRDAISLLPAHLDEELLCRTRRKLPPRHRMQKAALLASQRAQFGRWRFLLRQRCSLLFYGFGSKRALLETFARDALTDGGVLAVDGLAPGLTAKQVLAAAAGALSTRGTKGLSHGELLALICAQPPQRQLYLLLHNIDGPGLRSAEDQLWLSRLAQAPPVRLLASVDHVNAPLLWDARLNAGFRWLWLDVTSYAPYDAETASSLPIITSCKQSGAQRGAAAVLGSLVSSAREVFKLLASLQLADPGSRGVGFPELLRRVREAFIFNTQHALKSVLAEFRDHELIRLRPGADGGEVMYIPMEADVLARALADMEAGGGGGSE